jgi:hypothetical protein
MMFDANLGAADRQRKAFMIAAFLVWVSVMSTVVYVAAHFIAKFW